MVIVGCGFGGLEAARALRDADVAITVVDKTNHHLFQPLLYQVATAGLSSTMIAAPIRHLFRTQPNATVLLGEVCDVDLRARVLRLADGGELPYDHLIVAAGSTHSYFGNEAWAAHAPGLKTLEDALQIRRRVLLAFEAAERETDPVRRRDWLNLVVVGGGPTGVEMAGTLAEIARHTLPGEFRNFDPASANVLLIEGGDRVLASMPEELSEKALRQLRRLGVDVRLGHRIVAVDAEGVEVQVGPSGEDRQRIRSRCVVWGAGVAAAPLGRVLADAAGAPVDRAGRIEVAPDLALPGHPEVSVVGDLAAARSFPAGTPASTAEGLRASSRPVPGVSPAAKQMGRAAAANLQRRLRGAPTEAFAYRDYGNLATIGRNAAVVDLDMPAGRRLRFSGYPAWLFWLFAHIYFLIGFRNRVLVLFDWASAYYSFRRQARVVMGSAPRPATAAGTAPGPRPDDGPTKSPD
ncbi:MAG: NAD(P)/FAD-dependent oxidoreductase [Xylophilus ampelinus]